MKERIFPPLLAIVKPNGNEPFPKEDDKILTNNFDSGLEDDFDVVCNVVSVFPIEYVTITEVTKEENMLGEESTNYKLLCYYVMNNNYMERTKPFFRGLI